MSRFIFLDSGPLGLLSHPRNHGPIDLWAGGLVRTGAIVAISEIIDYEVRRELLRAGKQRGLHRLDVLKQTLYYVPLTTEMMLRAAEFWARARQTGRPTASPDALDVDTILAAQASLFAALGHEVVVATENPAHLSLFVPAKLWQDIT
jgi:toxin FitB